MRIIIVVSSFNPGTNEFVTVWERCLDDGTMRARVNDHMISIGNGQEWKIYVFNGVWYFENRNQESNMIKVLGNDITAVLNEYSVDSPIAILFHGMESDFNGLKGQISESLNNMNIVYEEYNSRSDIFGKYIQPFGRCDKNEEGLFENLWRKIEKKSPEDLEQKACSLRYKILSPLVALDLITQAGKDDGIKEKIAKAFDTIVKKDTEKGDMDQIDKLCELFECNDSEGQDDAVAGRLETRLRKLICESKETRSIKYEDLETIAGELETKIAEIPYQ